jgi:cyclopropane-fatty-acyl-phospholipid synthase
MSIVERSGLWATDIEILRLHYAKTLEHWRKRFDVNRQAIESLYDERFFRMFEFYLIGSELAFRRMGHMNWQLQLTKDVSTLPLDRSYISDVERRKLAALGSSDTAPLREKQVRQRVAESAGSHVANG